MDIFLYIFSCPIFVVGLLIDFLLTFHVSFAILSCFYDLIEFYGCFHVIKPQSALLYVYLFVFCTFLTFSFTKCCLVFQSMFTLDSCSRSSFSAEYFSVLQLFLCFFSRFPTFELLRVARFIVHLLPFLFVFVSVDAKVAEAFSVLFSSKCLLSVCFFWFPGVHFRISFSFLCH